MARGGPTTSPGPDDIIELGKLYLTPGSLPTIYFWASISPLSVSTRYAEVESPALMGTDTRRLFCLLKGKWIALRCDRVLIQSLDLDLSLAHQSGGCAGTAANQNPCLMTDFPSQDMLLLVYTRSTCGVYCIR